LQLVEFIKKTNRYGKLRQPFIFVIDFEMQKPFVCRLEQAADKGLLYNINGMTNSKKESIEIDTNIDLEVKPINKSKYKRAFNIVMSNLQKGNSYLLNLTFPTKLQADLSLEQIYRKARAPYKIWKKEDFVSFSPESFIKIENDFIFSYPMKGTIDASLPNASDRILKDVKETKEHNTIVDLIRNDLSIVSRDVSVVKYRYIDEIKTNKNRLLQVSSEIKGKLAKNWQKSIGDILFKLLPAGSISGAPKEKTVEIIKKAEGTMRGYYTGIFGLFDGTSLESAVNIRFIEKISGGLQFRSGGGITAMSKENEEYQEMVDKVYVPFS